MANPTFLQRIAALAISFSLALVTVPSMGVAGSVFGTIQVSGPAWVASDSADWSRLSTTRPLVAGDRLKTGSDGYLLADLGDSGVVGLYGDAEVTATDVSGNAPTIDVHRGKVAFHLSPDSNLKLQADGAGIASDRTAADGYVEYGTDGIPVVVVEEGALMVEVAGVDRKLSRGERMPLAAAQQYQQLAQAQTQEPIRLADAHGAESEEDDDMAGGAVAPTATTVAGIGAAGWTAIGVVGAAVVGGVVAATQSSSGGGGDGPGS